MPVDINSSINSITRSVFGNDLLSVLVGKPWALGALISFIFMFLIMVYYPAKSSTKMSSIFKIFVYIFLASSCLIFVHDGVNRNRCDEKSAEDTSIDMVSAIGGSDPVYGNYQKVEPMHNIVHRQQNIEPAPTIEQVESLINLPRTTLGGSMPPVEKENRFKQLITNNV